MSIYAVSVAHMRPEIIAFSMARVLMTTTLMPVRWVFVDNIWPIEKEASSSALLGIRDMISGYCPAGAVIVKPEKNLGGHGGFNFGFQSLVDTVQMYDDDLILGYDPDSNVITKEWISAMAHVMTERPDLNYVSLMHNHILERPYKISDVKGVRIAELPHAEMANVTMWRSTYLKAKQGIQAGRKYYGFVETSMFEAGKSAYLYDYREDLCPVPHDPLYNQWKGQHAIGAYPGNFDDFVKEKTP